MPPLTLIVCTNRQICMREPNILNLRNKPWFLTFQKKGRSFIWMYFQYELWHLKQYPTWSNYIRWSLFLGPSLSQCIISLCALHTPFALPRQINYFYNVQISLSSIWLGKLSQRMAQLNGRSKWRTDFWVNEPIILSSSFLQFKSLCHAKTISISTGSQSVSQSVKKELFSTTWDIPLKFIFQKSLKTSQTFKWEVTLNLNS